jgi:SAM-dependent methyltransferase
VSELEFTGERLVPEAVLGELVLAEHLARYRLAARLAAGRRVLDAACGEGYGTALLARAGAASVVGIDIDAATVRHARERHEVDARRGDVTALELDDGSFDLVVSFETIEHVAEPERALDELVRVLAPDGVLLVSTPNPREYLVNNPFHVRELAPEELLDALRARLPAVRPLYQQNFLTSAVLDEERLAAADGAHALGLDATKVAAVEPGRELYTVALAARGELPALEADVAVLASIHEAHRMARDLRAWPERAAEAERLVADWEARATEAERVQREWEQRATTAERVQAEWQARATEAERQNAELRAALDRIAGSMSWRVTKPLRRLRGR